MDRKLIIAAGVLVALVLGAQLYIKFGHQPHPHFMRIATKTRDGQPAEPHSGEPVKIFLQQNACLSGCTRYAILINTDGMVGYVAGSEQMPHHDRISQQHLASLGREARAMHFWSLKDQYKPGGSGCRGLSADAKETVVIGVSRGDSTNVLHVSPDCPNLPAALRTFIRHIHQAVVLQTANAD